MAILRPSFRKFLTKEVERPMKDQYERPILEIVEIDPEDIILTSSCGGRPGEDPGRSDMFSFDD